MNTLGQRIAALIAAQGPVSIAEFMTMALHDPQGGYYATRDPFGAAGDFITAPEISQMFGEFLGLWCVQVWHDQGRPAHKRLVELGPGRGTLMDDALRAMRVAPEFLNDLEIVLVEASPTLRDLQRQRLKEWGDQIRWTDRFDESLGDRPLFLLANEFFDALPIRQYVKTVRGWCERMVTADASGALAFVLSPVPAADITIPPDRAFAPDGGVYEVSPAGLALTEEIARVITHQGGGALIVDYGYDASGFGETLQAVAATASRLFSRNQAKAICRRMSTFLLSPRVQEARAPTSMDPSVRAIFSKTSDWSTARNAFACRTPVPPTMSGKPSSGS